MNLSQYSKLDKRKQMQYKASYTALQGGHCGICGRLYDSEGILNSDNSAMDFDSDTGELRGVLCLKDKRELDIAIRNRQEKIKDLGRKYHLEYSVEEMPLSDGYEAWLNEADRKEWIREMRKQKK